MVAAVVVPVVFCGVWFTLCLLLALVMGPVAAAFVALGVTIVVTLVSLFLVEHS